LAEYFKKQHAHVLRDIKSLDCDLDFRLSNFGESYYINAQNKRQPEYVVTQDGFTLVAMGFTGTIETVTEKYYQRTHQIIEQHGKTVVSGRDIYDLLKSQTVFATWASRCLAYCFIKDVDYHPYSNLGSDILPFSTAINIRPIHPGTSNCGRWALGQPLRK
jgi:Rha family phage regulatory protein